MIPRAPRVPITNGCAVAMALLLFVACEPARELPNGTPRLPPDTPRERAAPPIDLELGQILEGELAPGEARVYRIDAAADQYLHVVVDQRGVDVVVTLERPDGERLLQMDRPIDDHGSEPVFAITREAGTHHLQLEAQAGSHASGKYTIRFAESKLASEADRARADAAGIYTNARGHYRTRDYRKATEQFRAAATAWEELGELSWQGESLVLLGQSHARMSEWQTAIGCYERAMMLFKETGNTRWEAIAHHHIGLTHFYLRDLEPAIESFRKALLLRRGPGARRGKAITYHALAQAFQLQDEVQQSLDYYAQALKLFEKAKDRAPSIHNRGVLFLSMGRMDQARDALIEAEEYSATVGDRRRQAATLNQLGELHRRQGDLDTAHDYFSKALTLRRALKNDRRGEANSLANVGRVHQARGDHVQALASYQDALEILGGLQQPWLAARVLLNLGSLYLDQGQISTALEVFGRSLSLYRDVGDPTGKAEALLGVARSERKRGDLTAAMKASEQALQIFESVRPKAVRYDLRSSFFATVQRHFEFHIDLLMELHRLEPGERYDALALMVSEQARARSLLDLLVEGGAEIRSGAAPELLERERVLQGQLNVWEKRRLQLHNDPRHTTKQLAKVEKAIRGTLQKLAEVQGEIRTRHPRYAELNRGQAIDTHAIQHQALDDGTLLLEYWLGEERSFLWAVTARSVESFELPGREELESLARRAYQLLTRSNRREAWGTARNTLCELSRELLQPAADLIARNRLLIVADGALQFIPFAALPKPGTVDYCLDPVPLVVEHEIIHLPSASILPVLRRGLERPSPAKRSVAVVADPVFSASDQRVRSSLAVKGAGSSAHPRSVAGIDLSTFERLAFSRKEADAILALDGTADGYIGFDATKETVTRGLLADYQFVHFATHGILDTTHPELSGIVLTLIDREGRPQDGFLRAHEIYNLEMPSELVVLSACQTALGKAIRGEGFVGLTRGFMYAGAARLMVSLWNVSDEGTAELMEVFYRGLLEEHQRPAAALRAAQISMLENDARKAPYYWAAFVLQGEWR